MTQVGEKVGIGEFVSDTHSESTCPWHERAESTAKKMEATNPDEDTAAMPPNDGGTLGRNLDAANDRRPDADYVSIAYAPFEQLRYQAGKKSKIVQTYVETEGIRVDYDLQYAPHHLIPGNESLKGSKLVPFMGDADSISEYSRGQSSRIKDGFSVGYDVNAAANGVWLPSPYALSNSNAWPAMPGVKVVKKRRGVDLGGAAEDFKEAYVAESIAMSGGRQFHMRHKGYSDKVREILNTIAQRMKLMAKGQCPIASGSKQNGKFDPPMGLLGRLNVLSQNLRGLVTGGVWRDPLFTDAMTKDYAEALEETTAMGSIEQVV